jgi:hypothetical protein
MIKKIIILLIMITVVMGNPVRIYERIPRNYVANTIFYFVKENDINNCFSYREDYDHLLLKCLRDAELLNIEITINPNLNENYYFKKLSSRMSW